MVLVWDSKTILAANGLLNSYKSFTFIASFVCTRNAMSMIRPITVMLQYRNVIRAYSAVKNVIDEIYALLEMTRKVGFSTPTASRTKTTTSGECGALFPRGVLSQSCGDFHFGSFD